MKAFDSKTVFKTIVSMKSGLEDRNNTLKIAD